MIAVKVEQMLCGEMASVTDESQKDSAPLCFSMSWPALLPASTNLTVRLSVCFIILERWDLECRELGWCCEEHWVDRGMKKGQE